MVAIANPRRVKAGALAFTQRLLARMSSRLGIVVDMLMLAATS
jgi:hypothetical protein